MLVCSTAHQNVLYFFSLESKIKQIYFLKRIFAVYISFWTPVGIFNYKHFENNAKMNTLVK